MIEFFLNAYKNTSNTQIAFEIIAFVFGIISVIMAKKENILVYPTGIIATIITVYLLYNAQYFGDMTVNIYYSIMSIYGWMMWRKSKNNSTISITTTTTKEKYIGFLFFLTTMIVTFFVYQFFDYAMEIPNYIDIFTSGIFFTAMWLMANKKIENWILWIVGDIIVVPLFAYRGLGMLALQYLIFTILAISAYYQWKKILNNNLLK
jgi:nicotinamide mononucleotide transporter